MNIWNRNMPFCTGRFWVKHHSLFYCNAVCKPAPPQQHCRHVTLHNLSILLLELNPLRAAVKEPVCAAAPSQGDTPHDQCILSHEPAISFTFLASWHNFIQWDNEADSAFSQHFFFLTLCNRVLLPLWFNVRGDGSRGHDVSSSCWHWLCEDRYQKSVTLLIAHSCMVVGPLRRQRTVILQLPY